MAATPIYGKTKYVSFQSVKQFGSRSGLSVLICVQIRTVGPDLGPTVCKDYEQMTKVAADMERVSDRVGES